MGEEGQRQAPPRSFIYISNPNSRRRREVARSLLLLCARGGKVSMMERLTVRYERRLWHVSGDATANDRQ
ncbi:hypothetical protein COCON_G00060040 [Conger conger]|uniref:Uncharacterized protein n=1 Tax=Conger conger TaxID=82655 RepID=A0A9Q1DR42_CONCO|nr:hypothetical protein COCON_G00060040 [Conger conger]